MPVLVLFRKPFSHCVYGAGSRMRPATAKKLPTPDADDTESMTEHEALMQ